MIVAAIMGGLGLWGGSQILRHACRELRGEAAPRAVIAGNCREAVSNPLNSILYRAPAAVAPFRKQGKGAVMRLVIGGKRPGLIDSPAREAGGGQYATRP